MIDEPIYTLLSVESDVARPRILKQGSLPACLGELAEVILSDVPACNRARLTITATDPRGGKGAARTIVTTLVAGEGV